MLVPFAIKQLNYVQLARSPSIYSCDLTLRWSHGHPFMIDFNDIKQSFLPL